MFPSRNPILYRVFQILHSLYHIFRCDVKETRFISVEEESRAHRGRIIYKIKTESEECTFSTSLLLGTIPFKHHHLFALPQGTMIPIIHLPCSIMILDIQVV